MAVNGRPCLPEVSSAPSWFEFSSFLLTLAAEADMVSRAESNRRLKGICGEERRLVLLQQERFGSVEESEQRAAAVHTM